MDFEKLGSFYLGKNYDIEKKSILNDEYTLLRSKDLTTHAVCLGMTGSGKTGLCISLLEEAAIDNIPIIAIDPKGDISNLLLTFSEMTTENFKPWVSQSEADQKNISIDELAKEKSELWSAGIQKWNQDTSRIKNIHKNLDMRIYTPGDDAGLSLSLYGNFIAPDTKDLEVIAEKIENTITSYLSIIDKNLAEVGSPAHSFLSEILKINWLEGKSLSFPDFIGAIINPPFDKVGALPLDAFFDKSERSKIAMKFNALYASPSFKKQSQGTEISIPKLLYGENGKTQVSIISISHLDEKERIFVVAKILNELVSWTRKQTGTSSLRALLYMDEIYGYFPPNGNPPTKKPMLTLLKQARAQGVGVVLATQNPVDLDYRGLSNTGTWFIGRLQTEQDKARLLEGLKSISTTASVDWNKALSSLDKRVFLLQSVHNSEPVIFHTRWALSFLSGPINSAQIKKLMGPYKQNVDKSVEMKKEPSSFSPANITKEVSQKILENTVAKSLNAFVAAQVNIFIKHPKTNENINITKVVVMENNDFSDISNERETVLSEVNNAINSYNFIEPPATLLDEKYFTKAQKDFENFMYRNFSLNFLEAPDFKEYSAFNESEDEFKGRLQHIVREKKDEVIDQITKKYEKKIDMIEGRITRAEQKVEKEKEQYSAKKTSAFLDFGTAVASVLLGGKKISATNARRAGSVFRSASSASKEKGDISRAEALLEDYEIDLQKIKDELEDEILKIEEKFSIENINIQIQKTQAFKKDIEVTWCGILWK